MLENKRADYGKQVIKKLSAQLTEKYGSGWGVGTLKHCLRVAEIFSEEQIRYAVRIQLSWTHLRSIMSIEDELARQFYMEMCAIEHWSTRTLDEKIDGQLYQRTAISRRPDELIKKEYLMLDENSSVKVAQYYTKLPDKKILADKLQRAIEIAKERLAEVGK